jgi:hypothetical protein
VLYTRRSPAKAVIPSDVFGLYFLLVVFVYSLVSRYSCLCVAQVLLEFSLFRG